MNLIYRFLFLFIRGEFPANLLGPNLLTDLIDELSQWLLSLVTGKAAADRNKTILLLLGTHDQHIGNLVHTGLTDLVANLFRPVVHLDIHTVSAKFFKDFLGIIRIFLGNRKDTNLLRAEPGRELAGIFLDEPGQGSLVASQRSPVDDIGALLLSILSPSKPALLNCLMNSCGCSIMSTSAPSSFIALTPIRPSINKMLTPYPPFLHMYLTNKMQGVL